MSGHGVECIGEGELVGQVELVVQGEELEDVGVWSVRVQGQGSSPAAVAERAFAVSEPADRAGVGEAVLGNAAERWVDAERERVLAGRPAHNDGRVGPSCRP
jgi:collagenase-like PrtC family protease